MEKEYIAGEPQRYEIGGRVFIVEPRYRKDGESMADILLKLMFADLDEEMRAANKTTRQSPHKKSPLQKGSGHKTKNLLFSKQAFIKNTQRTRLVEISGIEPLTS